MELVNEKILNVDDAEVEFLKHPQVDCPVIHTFGPGTYIRQVTIPAGSLAIGHHQNFEQMNIFLKGKVSMYMEDGSIKTLEAPMMFVGPPGRKIGYVHEDMVWLNVYATTETDVEKLEAHFLTKSETWQEGIIAHERLQIADNRAAQEDYLKVLSELGFDEKTVRAQSEDESDIAIMTYGSYKVKVNKSQIEGFGLFATAPIRDGEIICPARVGEKRTIAGRYTNHSHNPNAEMIEVNGDIILKAIRNIDGCRGGLDGEEITIDYKKTFNLNLEISKKETLCLE